MKASRQIYHNGDILDNDNVFGTRPSVRPLRSSRVPPVIATLSRHPDEGGTTSLTCRPAIDPYASGATGKRYCDKRVPRVARDDVTGRDDATSRQDVTGRDDGEGMGPDRNVCATQGRSIFQHSELVLPSCSGRYRIDDRASLDPSIRATHRPGALASFRACREISLMEREPRQGGETACTHPAREIPRLRSG